MNFTGGPVYLVAICGLEVKTMLGEFAHFFQALPFPEKNRGFWDDHALPAPKSFAERQQIVEKGILFKGPLVVQGL